MSEPAAMTAARGVRALTVAAALALVLNGCLKAESQDESYTIHADGTRGDYVVVLHNVQSDGQTPHHQQKDFEAMVELLESDDYLLNRLQGGIYVKKRSITVEKGLLVAREEGLFSAPASVGLMRESDGTLRRRVAGDHIVTATNGRVYMEKDSTFIGWPKATREFIVNTRDAEFRSNAGMVERFQAWKAKHK